MADLPPGFILDTPQGGMPSGFVPDSPMKDAPNAPASAPAEPQDSPDDTMKYLAQMAKAIYGASKAAIPGAAIAEPLLSASPSAMWRGVKREQEPPTSGMPEVLSNIAGRAAIPTAIGMGTGMALGPAGAGTGALRAMGTTALTEGAAGLAGELGGQLSARALGNKDAISGTELAAQGALSAGLGGVARGVGELAYKGIPAAKQSVKSVADLAAKYGIDLTPAELKSSRALAGLEVMLEKTMFGSGGIAARREANAEALRVAKDKLLAKAGTDKERQAIGLAFFDKVKERAEGFNNAVRTMYDRVASVVRPGDKIDANNFISTAERLAASQKRTPFGGGGAAGQKIIDFYDGGITYTVNPTPEIPSAAPKMTPTIKGAEDVIDPLTGAVKKGYPSIPGYQIPEPGPSVSGIDLPKPGGARTVTIKTRGIDPATGQPMPIKLTPQELIEVRTDITQAIADNDAGLKIGLRTMSSREAGAYKRLLASVEKDLDAYAASGAAGKEFVDKYRAAKGLAELNYKIFNNKNVVAALKRNPEAVTSIIGRDSVSEIQQLKRAAGEKGFDEIRKLWLSGLLNEEKNATGKSLVNALAKHSDDTLREVFKSDKQALKDLMEIAKLQELVGSAERMTPLTGSARGVVTTGLSTIGAMLGSPFGAPGAAAGVLGANLAPAKIAQIYLSPTMRKIVLDGLRAAPGSRAKAIAAARIAAFVGKSAATQ